MNNILYSDIIKYIQNNIFKKIIYNSNIIKLDDNNNILKGGNIIFNDIINNIEYDFDKTDENYEYFINYDIKNIHNLFKDDNGNIKEFNINDSIKLLQNPIFWLYLNIHNKKYIMDGLLIILKPYIKNNDKYKNSFYNYKKIIETKILNGGNFLIDIFQNYINPTNTNDSTESTQIINNEPVNYLKIIFDFLIPGLKIFLNPISFISDLIKPYIETFLTEFFKIINIEISIETKNIISSLLILALTFCLYYINNISNISILKVLIIPIIFIIVYMYFISSKKNLFGGSDNIPENNNLSSGILSLLPEDELENNNIYNWESFKKIIQIFLIFLGSIMLLFNFMTGSIEIYKSVIFASVITLIDIYKEDILKFLNKSRIPDIPKKIKKLIKKSDKIEQLKLETIMDIKNYFNKNINIMNQIKDNYIFNEFSGKLEFNGKNKFKSIVTFLNENKILGINEIYMVTEQDSNIYFDINNIKFDNSDDNISYIEKKPIHLVFIIIYLINNNLLNTNVNISPKQKFMYSYDNNNNLILYKKDDNNNLVSNITLAINNLDSNHIKNTCYELFKSSPDTQECSKHFYSILGKSAISMIINLKEQIISKDNIISNLLNANPSIQYEIIKNLDWKFKINDDNINELITVDEWLEQLIEQKILYINFFSQNNLIKNTLDKMIININNNTKLLETPKIETNKTQENNSEIIIKHKKRNILDKMIINNIKLKKIPIIGINKIQEINSDIIKHKRKRIQKGGTYNDLVEKLKNINKKISINKDIEININIKEIKNIKNKLNILEIYISKLVNLYDIYEINIIKNHKNNLIDKYNIIYDEYINKIKKLAQIYNDINLSLL